MLRRESRQPDRADFLRHLEQYLAVEAQAPAHRQYRCQGRQIDRMLPLVVRRAPTVPAFAVRYHGPRVAVFAPIPFKAAHHIAMAIAEQSRQIRVFQAFRH